MDSRRPALGTVAALFVDARGCYAGAPGVDAWPEERDARRYRGPHPVVAHPPCNLWVNFAAVNWARYGRQRPAWYAGGSDGGCFAAGLAAVLAYGGVLEHPAGTHAWASHGLTPPPARGWGEVADAGERYWVAEVWQSAYGHPTRKRTWLLYASPRGRAPPELIWSRGPGTHQIGWFDRNKPTLGRRAASATPVAFRDALLALARGARG